MIVPKLVFGQALREEPTRPIVYIVEPILFKVLSICNGQGSMNIGVKGCCSSLKIQWLKLDPLSPTPVVTDGLAIRRE